MSKTDETEIETRHKRHLEKIRQKEQAYDSRGQDDRRSSETSSGSLQTTQGSGEGSSRPNEGNDGILRPGAEGIQGSQGIAGGHGTGIRSADPKSLNSTEGYDRADNPPRTAKLTVDMTEEERAEKERERNRQKQQRFRDKKREEAASSEGYGYGYTGNADNVTPIVTAQHPNGAKFALKSPFPVKKGPSEPVKLLSKTEAEDARESLIDLFCKGSSLLDDVLEIVVKGHEPVKIWEMDEDEAALFVEAHLKRAQKEQDAARVARKLLQIYDKLFTFQYLWSRSKATFTHVKDHGGLSFR